MVLVSSHLMSSKISYACHSDRPSLNMFTYFPKSVVSKGPSLDTPSFFINRFWAATTAGAQWKAFFTSQELRHGRDTKADLFFLRVGGAVASVELTTGFENTRTNNVGLDTLDHLRWIGTSRHVDKGGWQSRRSWLAGAEVGSIENPTDFETGSDKLRRAEGDGG
jgi:hypothetical protein